MRPLTNFSGALLLLWNRGKDTGEAEEKQLSWCGGRERGMAERMISRQCTQSRGGLLQYFAAGSRSIGPTCGPSRQLHAISSRRERALADGTPKSIMGKIWTRYRCECSLPGINRAYFRRYDDGTRVRRAQIALRHITRCSAPTLSPPILFRCRRVRIQFSCLSDSQSAAKFNKKTEFEAADLDFLCFKFLKCVCTKCIPGTEALGKNS